MPVNQRNADAIREAMAKLLEQSEREGPECLTWNNVCSVSGVPRATAARAHDLIEDWKRRVADMKRELGAQAPATGDYVHDRQRRDGETIRHLRETIRIMANQIQALTLALHEKSGSDKDRGSVVLPLQRR